MTASLVADIQTRATVAAHRWRPAARLHGVRPLTGGSSSLTFLADVDGVPDHEAQVVLKVAPPNLKPVRNRDVLRQGRLMRALHDVPGVVVPPVLFEDDGSPPFVGMGFVRGVCVEPGLTTFRDPDAFPQVRARALDAARVLAALHTVDPGAIGLGDEPVVMLETEVERWTRAFGTVPEDLQGDYERCAKALHASVPAALPPRINHGDYRLGNTLCDGDRVTAVIDWEIWSVGDPRVDITWLTFFTDEEVHPGAPSREPTGMPSAQELLDEYLTAGGWQDLPDLNWFKALTRYKEAAATALLIKHSRRSGSVDDSLTRMEPALPRLLDEAHELLDTR